MPALSMTADATIAKAKDCYALGLISEQKLEFVIRQASTDPSYNDCIDLPFDWDVERERELRRQAARQARLSIFRRLLGR